MERTTSALMPSMPTRSSSPTAVSPGRTSVCGERPAPTRGTSITAPSIRQISMMGSEPPSQCGKWTDGKMLCPVRPRTTIQPHTSAPTATRRRSRIWRRRSLARVTSALPRMDYPTIPDTDSPGWAPSPGAPGKGPYRQADS